ncbi:conserved hypothetical protein [Sulfurovum sp. enrichment culture clone C5]|uniref:Uncharacterized protein n=1 Tax=Sulfurovum sp. enrichment culture clone C5 TaxID=497650 RepID=A0A0S4XLF3_9BACT|nr:conserved hypothetical protein [Sulfurovum sp. enrichment culture clone C5]
MVIFWYYNKMKEKELLLQEIEKLMSYGKDEPTINPSLLEFLDIQSLRNIKKSLENKVGTLSEDDKEWLEQFKKYE